MIYSSNSQSFNPGYAVYYRLDDGDFLLVFNSTQTYNDALKFVDIHHIDLISVGDTEYPVDCVLAGQEGTLRFILTLDEVVKRLPSLEKVRVMDAFWSKHREHVSKHHETDTENEKLECFAKLVTGEYGEVRCVGCRTYEIEISSFSGNAEIFTFSLEV